MKTSALLAPVLCGMLISASNAGAGERQELLQLRATTLSLIEVLVQEGVLSQEGADQLLERARTKAEAAVAESGVEEPQETKPTDKSVVRVPYVPQFVRDEIRNQVRNELRADVTADVLSQARQERWGIPEALPEWTRNIKLNGDVRLRTQGDLFGSGNIPFGAGFVDFNEVNKSGGFTDAFLNTDVDRYRARVRARLGIDGKMTNTLKAGLRISTGNITDPVSTNQTLGNDFTNPGIVMDRIYIQYDPRNLDRFPYLTLRGGRMPNPWFSATDLVWDNDLAFDGAAGTYRVNLSGSGLMARMQSDRRLFFTLGAFSLDEIELSTDDKWLFGAQAGMDFRLDVDSSFRAGLSYYDYHNIAGRRNTLDSRLLDHTAPGFVQKGNSMFEISNDSGSFGRRFGLAADFSLLNLGFEYVLTLYSPTQFKLSGDYVRNVGYDVNGIRSRLAGNPMFVDSSLFISDPSDKQNEGYQLKLSVGWPNTLLRGNWQASIAYRYLERDAVLDAFTDSDFHLGGTNAKGWMLEGSYSLTDNTYMTIRYLSADEISGPPLGIDVLQLDLNAKF